MKRNVSRSSKTVYYIQVKMYNRRKLLKRLFKNYYALVKLNKTENITISTNFITYIYMYI